MNYKSYGKIIILTALIIAFIESIILVASSVYYGSEISIFYLIVVLIGFIVSVIKTIIAGLIFAIIFVKFQKIKLFEKLFKKSIYFYAVGIYTFLVGLFLGGLELLSYTMHGQSLFSGYSIIELLIIFVSIVLIYPTIFAYIYKRELKSMK